METKKEIEELVEKNYCYFNKNINEIKINDIKNIITGIINSLSIDPLIRQEQIYKSYNFKNINNLKAINKFIRENNLIQNIITKKSISNKYWNTILPFAGISEDVISNKYRYPMRIALFPGVSCMFYCGFCGRNQKAKYDSKIIDEGVNKIIDLLNTSPSNTKISISGGLEPLTNPKIGSIIHAASKKGFKVPLITNGYSLTEAFINKNPQIWELDSLRISLYGHDINSYKETTRVEKSFSVVQKNLLNFLRLRNKLNKNLKVGLNFIILPENMNNLIQVLEFINNINANLEGLGVNFLTLRDDYQSVTGNNPELDNIRKYRFHQEMTINLRKELLKNLQLFKNKAKQLTPDLHIDYGYSLEYLSKNVLDRGLVKVSGKELRGFGFTQMSVAVDLHGDVFLFREAGFLDRPGNKKVIIGRINNNLTLEEVIKKFLKKNIPIDFNDNDARFLDSFDHVLNALVNQSEDNNNFGISLSDCPISFQKFSKEKSVGNNWYSDDI